MLKKKWLVTSYLALVLGISACNDVDLGTNPPIENNNTYNNIDDSTTDDQQVDTGFGEKYGEIRIANDAYDIFIDKNPNSKVEKLELDYDNGEYLYEIKGFDEINVYKMEINAVTGKVIKYKEKAEKREKQHISKDYINRVEEFVNKTIQDTGEDIEYLEWDLEIEDGRPEIEIEVERTSGQVEYTYDLESGILLEKDR